MRKSPTAQRFDILVCYDVDTTSSAGRRRLRRVAKKCEAHGQRVQFSVFECRLTPEIWVEMRADLLSILEPEEDSLRIYWLAQPREKSLEVHGRDTYVDYSGPLMV